MNADTPFSHSISHVYNYKNTFNSIAMQDCLFEMFAYLFVYFDDVGGKFLSEYNVVELWFLFFKWKFCNKTDISSKEL